MARLNNDERNQAIGMLNVGMSATVVSRHFVLERLSSIYGDDSVSQETLPTVLEVVGNVQRATTAADDRYIVLQHLRNRRLTATAAGRQYGTHPQTVRNRLRQNTLPIRADRPYFGHILTRRHRTAKLDWCRRHLHFRRADLDFILLSDECWFNLTHTDGRERVHRRRGESFADA